jgi:quercetin dioxygenase-like cupin family protein
MLVDVGSERSSPGLRIIRPDDWGRDLGLIPSGTWREIVGARTNAACRSLYHLELPPNTESVALVHDDEAVYYVADGQATITEHFADDGVARHALPEGAMAHVRPATVYTIHSTNGARLVGGPCPPDPAIGDVRHGETTRRADDPGITTFHKDRPGLTVPLISADARLIVWLGVGAVTANMNYVVLQPGERNTEHSHAQSEDTIHILEGFGTAENVSSGERLPFGPGDTVHTDIGVRHAIAADRGHRIVSVGGPCPADTDMLRAVGVDVDTLVAKLARS